MMSYDEGNYDGVREQTNSQGNVDNFQREIYLLQSPADRLPPTCERPYLARRGLGLLPKPAVINLSWPLSHVQVYICSLFQPFVRNHLTIEGFRFARLEEHDRIVKLDNVTDAANLKEQLNDGKLIIVPNQAFPQATPLLPYEDIKKQNIFFKAKQLNAFKKMNDKVLTKIESLSNPHLIRWKTYGRARRKINTEKATGKTTSNDDTPTNPVLSPISVFLKEEIVEHTPIVDIKTEPEEEEMVLEYLNPVDKIEIEELTFVNIKTEIKMETESDNETENDPLTVNSSQSSNSTTQIGTNNQKSLSQVRRERRLLSERQRQRNNRQRETEEMRERRLEDLRNRARIRRSHETQQQREEEEQIGEAPTTYTILQEVQQEEIISSQSNQYSLKEDTPFQNSASSQNEDEIPTQNSQYVEKTRTTDEPSLVSSNMDLKLENKMLRKQVELMSERIQQLENEIGVMSGNQNFEVLKEKLGIIEKRLISLEIIDKIKRKT